MRKHHLALSGAMLGLAAISYAVNPFTNAATLSPHVPAVTEQPSRRPNGNRETTMVPLDPVHALIQQLQMGDTLARQDAADALGKLGTAADEAVPALQQSLSDPFLSRVSRDALIAITKSDPQPNTPRILDVRMVLSIKQKQRWAIVTGMVPANRASPLELPFLMRSLRNDNWEERILAAESMATLGPLARPALDSLLGALEDEWPLKHEFPSPQLMLNQLGGYSSFGSFPMPAYGVRAAAVKALLAIGPTAEERLLREGLPRLIAGLERGSLLTRRHTARAVGLLGPRARLAVPALLDVLRHPEANEDTMGEAFTALTAIGRSAALAIASFLGDEREKVQLLALDALGQVGKSTADVASKVVPLLQHRSTPVWTKAIQTLPLLDVGTAVTHLPSLLRRDPFARYGEESALPSTGEKALLATDLLGRIGPRARAAIPALARQIHETFTQDLVSSRAIVAIFRIDGRNEENISRMIKLWERSPGHRSLSEALRTLGPRAEWMVPTLLRHLRHDDVNVQLSAAKILRFIDPDEAKRAVSVRTWIRILEKGDANEDVPGAIELLSDMGAAANEAVPRLVGCVRDGWARDHLAHTALQKLGTHAKSAATVFRRYLDDKNDLLSVATSLACVEPADTEAVRILTAFLWYAEKHQSFTAISALAKAGSSARLAVPRLRRLLQDEDEGVRVEAAYALWRITGEEPDPQLFRRALSFPFAPPNWQLSPYQNAIRRLGQLAQEREWAADMLVGAWKRASAAERKEILKHLEDARLLGTEAIPIILNLLNEETTAQWSSYRADSVFPGAIRALTAFGPAAKEAIPLLRFSLLKANMEMVDPVDRCLDVIEGTSRQVK